MRSYAEKTAACRYEGKPQVDRMLIGSMAFVTHPADCLMEISSAACEVVQLVGEAPIGAPDDDARA